MPETYNLPFLTFQQQAAQLEARGLLITDQHKAAQWLGRIGYYRLQPYWTALRDEGGKFRNGASLAYAVDLYRFDASLRQCLAVALERIEVALRVQVSHAIGRRDALGHRKLSCLDPTKSGAHSDWLSWADDQLAECREEWLEDFCERFGGGVPTWMAVEAWSFGVVSKLCSIMNRSDRAAIAKQFVVNPETFMSWMRAAVTLRNGCAHHARLWNKPLIIQPAIPRTWEAKPIQHIGNSRKSETRIYAMLAILAHCLDKLGSSREWAHSARDLWASFPAQCGLSLADAGFPPDWETEAIWL